MSGNGKDCLYGGKSYTHGSKIEQAGETRVCQNGSWVAEGKAATGGESDNQPSRKAAECEYDGKKYSEGSRVCQAGVPKECTKFGTWESKAGEC